MNRDAQNRFRPIVSTLYLDPVLVSCSNWRSRRFDRTTITHVMDNLEYQRIKGVGVC